VVVVKTNLVTESRQKILKSEFPKTVVLEPVEIKIAGIYSDRALSNINSGSEIVHSGMQRATRSVVTSYSDVVRRTGQVEGNRCKELKLEKCKVSPRAERMLEV
jgi:hypothetical protein